MTVLVLNPPRCGWMLATPPVYSLRSQVGGEQRGLSEAAREIGRLRAATFDYEPTLSVGGRITELLQALKVASAEAIEFDWDGEGGRAVDERSFAQAVRFAHCLPFDISLPEVAADRDGEISFEWDRGPRAVFSVSVGRDGTLSYAGLFGHSKLHGVENLVSSIPRTILQGMYRIARDSRSLRR